jgi:D-amino-acid dehydrogenase
MKIAVVGAGIIGATTAYFLAKKGHEVVIFDREPAAAQMCSRANGGQISICNAETWNTWKNVRKGLKWMTQKDAPLLIRPMPSPFKVAWLAGFLWHTVNGTHKANTLRTIEIGKRSSDLYKVIAQEEQFGFAQTDAGLLHVYTNEHSMSEGRKSQELFESNGIEWKEVSPADIIKLDPSLKSFKQLQGGFLTSSDWTGDAQAFTKTLVFITEVRYGARTEFNSEVVSIDRGLLTWKQTGELLRERFDHVVLCNAHEMADMARGLGDFLNIYPVKGYSITLDDPSMAGPMVSLLDDDKKIVSCHLGSKLRVAGTAELDGANYDIRKERIQPLLNWTQENFPNVDITTYNPWACLRPMSSNMMPIVRQSKMKGVWYHGGHGHLGWTLGAATAEQLAEMIGAQ